MIKVPAYKIAYVGDVKMLKSEDYNCIFNKKTGLTLKYGKTKDKDPEFCPMGPEIVDLECTEICEGIGSSGKPCAWCYKANTPSKGTVMSFDTFKMIFDKLPKTVNQIAFGADAKLKSCPDLWKMMDYCIENKVVPNITAADIDMQTAEKLAKRVGAVSVSYYGNKEIFRASLENLKKAGVKTINVHCLISKETLKWAYELLEDWKSYPSNWCESDFTGYNEYVNAIVFLQLKTCGRGKGFKQVNQHEFTSLVEKYLDQNVPFGSDSCGIWKLVHAFEDLGKKAPIEYMESCESCNFSAYFSAEGKFCPCSFNETDKMSIDMRNVENFVKEVWYSNIANNFRQSLRDSKGHCPSYEI